MRKAMRFLALVLCILLAGGVWSARAEMVTVAITLTGRIETADGSVRTVTPEGEFRIWQNGEEVGVIAAGRQTITLNSRERIRIEPLPQSFAPEWDLSGAYLSPELSADGAQIIAVTVTAREGKAPETTETAEEIPAETPETETETPAEAEPAETEPEAGAEGEPAETEAEPAAPAEGEKAETEAEPETQPAADDIPEIAPETQPAQEAVQAPTLAPYTGVSVTPEPAPAGFASGSGTGSLRVLVFFDKNGNSNQGDYENGISDITVYLLNEAEEPLASAVTDAEGFAVFENVPAGRYRTRTNLPAQWYFTPYGGENSITKNAYNLHPAGHQTSGVLEITAGAEAQQGIGIHNNATSAGGFCWLEDEVDGLYKEGEAKVAGVVIRLKSKDDDYVYETVTDENGEWEVGNLRPGYYVLSCEGRDGLMLTRYTSSRGRRSYLTSDNPKRQMELKADERTEMNLGFNFASAIYGRCYLDANYNGLYDEGELPLPGVKLSVRFKFDDAEASSAVSGEDGTFVLDGMRGNQYSVTALLPADGSVFTKAASEKPLGNLFTARNDRRECTVKGFDLADMERMEMNIGAIYPGAVTGTVYYDDNFSGGLDGGEKTVSGFQVTLLDGEGNAVSTVRTGADGAYTAEGLTPGEYALEVTATEGYAFTKCGEGNVILNRTGGRGYSEIFRVELGERVSGRDIGMIRPGTVQGAVFADRNDNGLRDGEEDGMTGALVRLMSETEGEAFRAEIGADGGFIFDAVMPGRYYLEYTLPAGAVFARVTNGGNQITEAETAETGNIGRTDAFDFVTGQVMDAPACGALTLGRIEGIAYADHDGNGLMENEEPLAGMILRLIPSRQELEEVTAETNDDGAFLLDELRPDTYRLEVVTPDGMVMSRTDSMKLPLTVGKAEQAVSLAVPMGKTWLNERIGAVYPSTLSGQVWLDENNNGLFDAGERTPAGYRLTVTDETDGSVYDTLVTDEEGKFFAAGMIPGNFTVSMALDEKTLAPKEGDSVFREAGGSLVLSGIQLQENEHREGLLMGVVKYTSISGQAWIDRGGAVENLGGLKIVMKDPEGSEIAHTETDGSGNYRIDRLMPGTFILEVTAPEGCVIIEPDDPRLEGSLRSVILHSTNRLGTTDETELKMDQDLTGMDIGCVLPGRLGDYCWVDLNGDGLQAGDEPGLGHLRIELLRDGAVIAETETDEYGFYRFVDLYPATYTLRAYAPAEVKPTKRRTDLPIIASVLEEGEDSTAVSVPLTVESDRTRYNADLGFVCRTEGVLPAGAGGGTQQDWTPKY